MRRMGWEVKRKKEQKLGGVGDGVEEDENTNATFHVSFFHNKLCFYKRHSLDLRKERRKCVYKTKENPVMTMTIMFLREYYINPLYIYFLSRNLQ